MMKNIINLIKSPLRQECGKGTLQYGRLLPICAEDAPQFSNDVYNKRYTREKIASRFQQSGRSMIEMLGVLAIVGVLSVGGIAGYSKAMQKYRTNKTIDLITQISNGIHTLYTARNNYEGLDIKLLGKAKVIPQELIDYSEEISPGAQSSHDFFVMMCQKGVELACQSAQNPIPTTRTFHGTNPFGGKILLSVDSDEKAFSLNYLGLPEDACIDVPPKIGEPQI